MRKFLPCLKFDSGNDIFEFSVSDYDLSENVTLAQLTLEFA